MTKAALPDVKEKTKRLYAKDATPAGLSAQAEEYLAAGWLSDAIDFFDKARDVKGLERVMARAIDEGDAFLLRRCLKCLGKEDKDGEWGRLAEKALELGKLMFAREGFRMAGDRRNLDLVDAMLKPPPPPDQPAAEPAQPGATATPPPASGDGSSSTA
ncbi:MAG TPA: hypothetical protein PK668_10395 [Myxococcota bacterium]|nr:hypothetical protein [Myxococcota bacterium]HRY93428.1 hypothetical protein [Myxococcota bacterium]HSA22016.1 hypothetical protein [Myxococcota bacterium]